MRYNQQVERNFNIFVNNFYDEIYSFVYRQLFDKDIAQDLTQEIFVKVYTNIMKYNPNKSSQRTWIYRIATNHLINYYKKKKFNVVPLDHEAHLDCQDITIGIEKEEKIKYLVKVINDKLTEKQREIIFLHFFSDLTVREISESLNVPKQTIYSSLRKSLKVIKEESDKNGKFKK